MKKIRLFLAGLATVGVAMSVLSTSASAQIRRQTLVLDDGTGIFTTLSGTATGMSMSGGLTLGSPLAVGSGGLGITNPTAGALLLGNGTSAVTTLVGTGLNNGIPIWDDATHQWKLSSSAVGDLAYQSSTNLSIQNLHFDNTQDHSIDILQSGASTAGHNLSIAAGAGNSAAGGNLSLSAGTGTTAGNVNITGTDVNVTGNLKANGLNTSGSVPYVNASGALTQDNANFNYNSGTTTLNAGSTVNLASGGDYNIGGNRVLSVDGTANLFAGVQAGTLNSGQANTALGSSALLILAAGNYNTAAGYASLSANTSGSYNTAFGAGALTTNATGVGNTAIGYAANVATGALSNATAIGANASVDASNKIQLGDGLVTLVNTSGAYSTATGYRVAGAATSGEYLRGNGTNFVSSTIQAGDLPSTLAPTNITFPSTGTQGTRTIKAADQTGTDIGGDNISLIGGKGSATNGIGGDINITGGAGQGTGHNGDVNITGRNITFTGNVSLPAGSVSAGSVSLTQNDLMVGDGSSHGSALATANSSVLVTDGTGVPSLSTQLPKVGIGTAANSFYELKIDGTTGPTSGAYIASKDVNGTSIPFEIDGNTTGMTFNGVAGNTQGRMMRVKDLRDATVWYDMGIDASKNFYLMATDNKAWTFSNTGTTTLPGSLVLTNGASTTTINAPASNVTMTIPTGGWAAAGANTDITSIGGLTGNIASASVTEAAGNNLSLLAGDANTSTATSHNGGDLTIASGKAASTGTDGSIHIKIGGSAGTDAITINGAGQTTISNLASGTVTASAVSLTQDRLMVGDASSHGSALTTQNSAILGTSGTGVPSFYTSASVASTGFSVTGVSHPASGNPDGFSTGIDAANDIGIELTTTGGLKSPYIDFTAISNTHDYDGRILYSGNAGTTSGFNISSTATAAANNDIITALTLIPSFDDATKTGVQHVALNAGGTLQAPTVLGSTASNGTLALDATLASGNTGTNTAMTFNVGDNAGTTAMSIKHNGTVNIPTLTVGNLSMPSAGNITFNSGGGYTQFAGQVSYTHADVSATVGVGTDALNLSATTAIVIRITDNASNQNITVTPPTASVDGQLLYVVNDDANDCTSGLVVAAHSNAMFVWFGAPTNAWVRTN